MKSISASAVIPPLLDENIISGGKPVNVQVAMRYNSYKDKTYLWIGVPVISIEY